MKASSGGHDKCVEFLLDKGAKVDLQDEVSTVSQSIIVLICMFPCVPFK